MPGAKQAREPGPGPARHTVVEVALPMRVALPEWAEFSAVRTAFVLQVVARQAVSVPVLPVLRVLQIVPELEGAHCNTAPVWGRAATAICPLRPWESENARSRQR